MSRRASPSTPSASSASTGPRSGPPRRSGGSFAGARDLRFNGGFEQEAQAVDGTALPASWSVLPARHLVVARDRTRRRTGAASVRLESVAPGAGSGLLTIEPVDGGVRADRRAEVTAWVSGGQASGKLRLALEWFDGDLRRVGRSAAGLPLTSGSGWTPGSVRARPPAGAVFARIVVEAANLRGAVWVDDVGFSWR